MFVFWLRFNEVISLSFHRKIVRLLQIMACCHIGNKPLSEPVMTLFTNAYIYPPASVCWLRWQFGTNRSSDSVLTSVDSLSHATTIFIKSLCVWKKNALGMIVWYIHSSLIKPNMSWLQQLTYCVWILTQGNNQSFDNSTDLWRASQGLLTWCIWRG